jgi:hypothetical protein
VISLVSRAIIAFLKAVIRLSNSINIIDKGPKSLVITRLNKKGIGKLNKKLRRRDSYHMVRLDEDTEVDRTNK